MQLEERVTKLEIQFQMFLAAVQKEQDDIEDRLRRIERTVWAASGGVILAQVLIIPFVVKWIGGNP